MAKTDTMGLLTGIPSGGIDPMTAGSSFAQRQLQYGADRARGLQRAIGGMRGQQPAAEKIARAYGQKRTAQKNAFGDYLEKQYPNTGLRELAIQGVITPDNLDDFVGGADATARQGKRYTIRDSKGHLYAMTTKFDNATGSFDTVYAPIGLDTPPKPSGEITILVEEGISYLEKEEMGIGIEGKTTKEKEYQKLRTETIDMLPSLEASKTNLERAETLLNSITTGGPINLVATGLETFFGRKSATKAELEIILGQEMYKSLKPLFGGVISEGEREAIEAIYANLRKGNAANKGILKRLKQELDDAITKSSLYLNSETAKDFDMVLKQMFPEPSKTSDDDDSVIDFKDL